MIYKLNNGAVSEPFPGRCDLSSETSENKIQVDAEGIEALKQRVSNYEKVMQGDFGIPKEVFFNIVPININHLKSFIANNAGDLAAVRIYFSKKTDNKDSDDYELIFVPCSEVKDEEGKVLFYKDILEVRDGQVPGVIIESCRKPPDCTIGGSLVNGS